MGQTFGLISYFFSKRQLRVVLDGKSAQEYLFNAGVAQVIGVPVILLFKLMMPCSTLSVIRHLTCGNN